MAAHDEAFLTSAIRGSERSKNANGLHLLYHYRAVAKFKQGRWADSAQDAGAALSIEQSFTPASCCLAAALDHLGRVAEASDILQEALKLNPEENQAMLLLKQLGDPEEKAKRMPKATISSQSRTSSNNMLNIKQHKDAPQIHVVLSQDSNLPAVSDSKNPSADPSNNKRCSKHHKAMLPCGQLDTTVIPAGLRKGPYIFRSSFDGMNTNILIMLHGLGDSPKPFAALAQRMALPQTATLALAGALEVPETEGGRAWFESFEEDYELIQPTRGDRRRTQSLTSTVSLLLDLVSRLVSCGWKHKEIHLFGFSQVSGGLLEEMLWEGQYSPLTPTVNNSLERSPGPILITRGDRDQTTSMSWIDRTLEALRKMGASVRFFKVPGKGHGMISSGEEMKSIMSFWSETLRSRPPGEDVFEI